MFVRLVTTLAALALLAGCSTEEGLRAQELLRQAEAAQAQLRSSTFEGTMAISFDGTAMRMQFRGATSARDAWFSVRTSGVPGGGDVAMQVVVRDGRVSMNANGRWETVPAAQAGSTATLDAAAFQLLAKHVRDVRVTEHQLIEGKPVTTIAGEIDTAGMIEAMTDFGSVAPALGEGFDLSDLGIDFGDIHAVLTIDERTQLLDTAFVSFSLGAQGEEAEIELRYRLSSANEPVELPRP